MSVRSETRTIHTVYIDLPDEVMGKMNAGDEVEIVLNSRDGITRPMRVSWSNARLIQGEELGRGKR
jgi:hypothetical protein